MSGFIVKNLVTNDIESELEKIGFDSGYIFKAANKFRYKTLKIFDLAPAQANIIKQTALSLGADCATHREVITGNQKVSDVILGGSLDQLLKIAEKLQFQPFSLKLLGEKIKENLQPQVRKTKLVGVVNVTPDSFSDGGKYFEPKDAINHAIQLVEDGADIIDIGAESTRPYSKGVPSEIQIERLAPVLDGLKGVHVPISVDTRSSLVADYVLQNGASIINDVSGMTYDPRIGDITAKYGATIILQHTQGEPENMQDNPDYDDVVEDIFFQLRQKVELAHHKGIENLILDVGIGFGKTKEQNFELLNRIEEFYSLNLPLMVGVSRKSLLGLSESTDNSLKDTMTLAISYPLIQKNVDYLRVHNVKLHKQLLDLAI